MRDIRKSELSILALATVAAVALMYPYVGASHVEAAKRPELNPNDVELIISAKKTTLSVGEQPEITATLTNNSDRDLMLVRPLDGSDFGRFPQFVWTIEAPKDAPPPQPFGRCGNTNPITTAAFFTLPAGKSVELSSLWCPLPQHEINRGPGAFTIQVSYSTDSDELQSWIGGPLGDADFRAKEREVAPYLSQVPRVTVKSNVIELKFVGTED